MPAVTEKQRRFFGAVRGAQEGTLENPSEDIKRVAKSISKEDAGHFATSMTDKKGKKKMNKTNESAANHSLAEILEGMFEAPVKSDENLEHPIEESTNATSEKRGSGNVLSEIIGKILSEAVVSPDVPVEIPESTPVEPEVKSEDAETPDTDVPPTTESTKPRKTMEDLFVECFCRQK